MPPCNHARLLAALLCLLLLITVSLRAEPPAGWLQRDFLTPDPGGARARLAERGVALSLFYTAEVFGNPAGGYRQGAVYDGLLTVGVDLDLEKLASLKGLKFHVLAYNPQGDSGTNKYTRDLNRFSNIDAYDTVRLFEVWAEASFFDNILNVRAGQIAADAEFVTTQGGALFVNSSFGAFPILSLNVPVPIYPQAAPGLRLRLNSPDARFYFQTGLYAGNPDADRNGDPAPGFRAGTAYNNHGVRFPVSGNQGAFAIFETGFLPNTGKDARGLPGSYRAGGFYHSGDFSDLSVDDTGRSLADPLSTGRPRAHDGSGGGYLAVDQVVYRPPGPGGAGGGNQPREDVAQTASAPVGNAEDSTATAAGDAVPGGPELRLFGRLGFASADRAQAGFYVETGFNYRGLLPSRGRDLLGVAFSYTDLSSDLRQLARDTRRFPGVTHAAALPDFEAILETTYQANLTPWLSVQPDLQVIIHPGGSARTATRSYWDCARR